MKLCTGQCKYLIALYHLSLENRVVRSVDIANRLSVTRPSVSRMLKCMARLGIIEPDYSSNVVMTVEGEKTASQLVRNFNDVNSFFTHILKLDESSAYDQSILFLASFPENTTYKLAEITRNTLVKRNKKMKK